MKRILCVLVFLSGLGFSPALHADQNNPKLNTLFQRLQTTEDTNEALSIEQLIWQIWTERGVVEIDKAMAYGIQAMNAGAFGSSLKIFDQIVSKAPDFAEGWNKRATVYYMLGQFDASVSDIQRTLDLEPRHFGALSGMGLIYNATGNTEAALKVWEKALSIHPHMPGIRAQVKDIKRQLKGKAI